MRRARKTGRHNKSSYRYGVALLVLFHSSCILSLTHSSSQSFFLAVGQSAIHRIDPESKLQIFRKILQVSDTDNRVLVQSCLLYDFGNGRRARRCKSALHLDGVCVSRTRCSSPKYSKRRIHRILPLRSLKVVSRTPRPRAIRVKCIVFICSTVVVDWHEVCCRSAIRTEISEPCYRRIRAHSTGGGSCHPSGGDAILDMQRNRIKCQLCEWRLVETTLNSCVPTQWYL